jgi:glutamate synthase (NADPH/NADH) small chain
MARELTKKERLAIPRNAMPAQDAAERICNFDEVALGYTEEMAIGEAERCLECKKPKCVDSCPVGIDIPGFVAAVADGRFAEALAIIKADNTLPAICGRVCPQEDQCEETCVTGNKGDPVAIGRLERYVADLEREGDVVKMPVCTSRSASWAQVLPASPAPRPWPSRATRSPSSRLSTSRGEC